MDDCHGHTDDFLVSITRPQESTCLTAALLKHVLLLLLSRFSRARFWATPETAAHQAPPSLGFSNQEHWSGLPFPSPMHESEKVKVKSLSRVRLFAIPWTAAYQAPPPMRFSRQEYWRGVPSPSPKARLTILLFKLFKSFAVGTE